jgi:predicted Zn-ribbon and HTH transcriptional regulator
MLNNASSQFVAVIVCSCLVIVSPFILKIILNVRRARRDIRRSRERLLRDAFFCVTCGHDVRVNSGRCPECGAIVEAS